MQFTKRESLLAPKFLTVLVVIGMLVSAGVAQESRSIAVGKQVIEDMRISVELERPKMMQMMMKGMGEMGRMAGMGGWKTFRPKAGELTHHLTLVLAVPTTGERIPYAEVSATIVNVQTKDKMEKKLPAMFGENLIYGTNVFLKPGKYDLAITVEPPSVMRIEGGFDKWLKPIQANFSFQVQ